MDPTLRSLSRLNEDGGESHVVFLVAAVVVSLVLHTAFGYATRGARLSFLGDLAIDPAALRADARRPPEGAFLLSDPVPEDRETLASPAAETADPGREPVAQLLESLPTESPATFFDPPPAARGAEDADRVGVAPPVETIQAEPIAPWQPRERILEIASRFANDDLAARPRTELVPPIERQVRAEDVVAPFAAAKPVETALAAGAGDYVPPAPPPRGTVSAEADELLAPPVAAMPAEIEPEPAVAPERAASLVVEPVEDVRPAVPLDDVLAPRLSVFRPRRDDGFVYFEIDVVRKGADVLPPIPRDVLLVQDASRSLGPQRLAACRKALLDALSSLQPGDRFNILVFDTRNRFFLPGGWAAATPDNLAAAGAFLDSVSAEGNTDIFNAMKGALSLPRDPGRTAVALLLSDGVSTAGDFRRDSQIIGEFSRLNDGALSVFDVGVSKGSDEYLLSMLSFCNRGGPATIAADRFGIGGAVAGVFGTISAPVLSDIRFLFDSSSRAVVSPERTENLYLDRPLRLYGRAPAGTKSVSFQARGANAGRGYDMVYELPLGDPAPGDGDPAIARTWARTRIYDLVAAYARSADAGLLSEMAALGRAHDVKIPFDGRFLRH